MTTTQSGLIVSISVPPSSATSDLLNFFLSDVSGEFYISAANSNSDTLSKIAIAACASNAFVSVTADDSRIVQSVEMQTPQSQILIALYVGVDASNAFYWEALAGGEYISTAANYPNDGTKAGFIVNLINIPAGLNLYPGGCSIKNAAANPKIGVAKPWAANRDRVIFGLKSTPASAYSQIIDYGTGTAFFCTMKLG